MSRKIDEDRPLGASPRASTGLLLVAKAFTAREQRDFVIPDDVKEAALPVLRHRLVLRPEAELEGLDTDRVVRELAIRLGRADRFEVLFWPPGSLSLGLLYRLK